MATWKKIITESSPGVVENVDTTGAAYTLSTTLPIARGGTGRADLTEAVANVDTGINGVLIYGNSNSPGVISKISPDTDNQALSYTIDGGTFAFRNTSDWGGAFDPESWMINGASVSINELTINGDLNVTGATYFGGEYVFSTANVISLNSDGSGFDANELAGLNVYTSWDSSNNVGDSTTLGYLHPSSSGTTGANSEFDKADFAGKWCVIDKTQAGVTSKMASLAGIQVEGSAVGDSTNPHLGKGSMAIYNNELFICVTA